MKKEINHWSNAIWGLCTAIIVLSVNGILPPSSVILFAYFGVIVTAPISTFLVIQEWVTKVPKPVTWLRLAFGLGFIVMFIFAVTILWRFYTKESTAGSFEDWILNPIPYLSVLVVYLCFRAIRTRLLK